MPKLDRLARSVSDARAIDDDLAVRGIKVVLGGQLHDPVDPMGEMPLAPAGYGVACSHGVDGRRVRPFVRG